MAYSSNCEIKNLFLCFSFHDKHFSLELMVNKCKRLKTDVKSFHVSCLEVESPDTVDMG